MRCLICQRDFVALGVHVKHKHKITPAEYRHEFGLLKTKALVDDELSTRIADSQRRALQDPDYKAAATLRCLENSKNNAGKTHEMSDAGKAKLAKQNKEKNEAYLRSRAVEVSAVLDEFKTIVDVRRKLGVGSNAVKQIVAYGLASYSPEVAAAVATQRRVASRKGELV
jgi:hypothetical protein